MKVTCESCGSKYTIKDDKVRGKRVKIRCKGCKSPIVVDGLSIDGSSSNSDSENAPAYSDVPDAPDDTGLASAQAAFPAAGSTGAALERWSVNLSETDSRDMTTDEIVAAWHSGVVTDDAYIYKPGFDDWKPILEVPELARLVTSSGAPDAFSPPAGKSPFAAKSAAPRAAASGRRGDLFGAVAAAGGEDDAGIAAPPMVIPSGDGKATGARNESSVLFSLDALKAGFSGPAPAPAAPARHDDPFGLSAAPSLSLGGGFDQNAALFAPPPPEPKKPKKISLPPSVAPGAAAPAAGLDRGKLIMIAAGVLVLLLAVGGVGFALGGSGSDKDESGEQAGLEKEEPAKAREGSSKPDAEEKKDKAEEKDSAEAKKPDETEEKKAEAEKPAEETAKTDAEKAPEGTQATATKSTTATATATKTDTAAKTTKAEAPKSDSNAPPFNKSAAISALSSAAGSAAGCKVPGGPTGSGKAIVTFAPSGRVTSANVSGGKFGGSSVGGCVASRFRGARVPPFSGNAVTVSKSFTVP